MKKSTQELLDILRCSKQPSDFIELNKKELFSGSLADYLNHLLAERKLEKSEVIKKSGLDRTYGYQIFSGMKKPSRDKLLAIAAGMKMSFEEIQILLKGGGYPVLYPRLERDSVIIFCIQKGVSLIEMNELLYEMGLEILA